MEEIMRAYFAGCIDCDGSIGIKKSTYAMRVRGDAGQPVFSERVLFAQVKPEITHLLKEHFGGSYGIQKADTPNSHPIYKWSATDKQAVACIKAILPYLRIKRKQAEILLELRKLKEIPRLKIGTFKMMNRWHKEIDMPRRIVDPAVIQAKENLFNKIKSLNDIRNKQPQLIGVGYSGEEKPKRRRK